MLVGLFLAHMFEVLKLDSTRESFGSLDRVLCCSVV